MHGLIKKQTKFCLISQISTGLFWIWFTAITKTVTWLVFKLFFFIVMGSDTDIHLEHFALPAYSA